MDQTILVNAGHALILAMDRANLPPRFAMWVHATDTDSWKLWLVPPIGVSDKRDFYRRVSEIVSKNKIDLIGIDASDTEMMTDTHPAVVGLSKFMRLPHLGRAHFSGNRFNGFYLPDGIVLRSAL